MQDARCIEHLYRAYNLLLSEIKTFTHILFKRKFKNIKEKNSLELKSKINKTVDSIENE